ncbi:MAG: efflux RND transporter periplasmic adaptor subunit [Phycisphaerales bacterium]|nr:MAG: efflux RND transporter periplasmic adaptor subunit [Phycisphaerales bacterium]
MKGIRKTAFSLLLIVLLLAVGIAGSTWLVSTRPLPPRRDVNPMAPLVDALPLAARDIPQIFVGYGSARADREATLAAEVAAEIVEIPEGINDGANVRQGQLLIRLDEREYTQRLARANSAMAELDAQNTQLDVEKASTEQLIAIAEAEVEVNAEEVSRLSGLFEKGEASKTEYNFARRVHDRSRRELQVLVNQLNLIEPRRQYLIAARASRQAEAELARLYLERCRITAPFDGQVNDLLVQMGNRVMPGTPLLRLTCLKKIEVPIELPVSVRPLVQTGAPCTLTVDSSPALRWSGTLSRLSPVADVRSRTFSAYVMVDNDQQETPLFPGYFLTARVQGPLLQQVLAVPRGVIDNGELFVANDNRAHVRKVHVETVVEEIAIVSGDVQPGDRVILTNLDMLYEGATVRVQEVLAAEVAAPALVDRRAADGLEIPP